MDKKVLITGINSFTGVYLKKELVEHGYDVFGCDLFIDESKTNFKCNLVQLDEIKLVIENVKPDYIVHLAAITFVPHADTSEIYDVNLFGTLNLLDACLTKNVIPKKILIPSTANVYGTPNVEKIDESISPKPVNHYANSKLAMEHMVSTYFDKLPVIMTRPFNYTGVDQAEKFLIPKIVSHFEARKEEIELGNIDVIRDFSDVRFVVECYRKLLEIDISSEIVNICSGTGTSLKKIVEYCSKYSGYEIDVKVNPDFVRANEIKVLVGDNSKLFNIINDAKVIDIKETVEWMLQ